jgi:ubiquinone/menaquinone biosynthesis C-methylase UbiE
MGLYADLVFPRLMDWSMRALNDLRPGALARAHGDVLEVGFGTGLNLRYYPAEVKSLVALDPMAALRERVQERIAGAPFPVEQVALGAGGALPFPDARFDCVVTTWTICSIDEPLAALAEMRRVLRPGGRYLFIEHGRSDDPRIARWQDRLNPLQRVIGCGCNMNRPIDRLVRQAGFELDELDRFVHSGPRLLAEFYRGAARAAPTASLPS